MPAICGDVAQSIEAVLFLWLNMIGIGVISTNEAFTNRLLTQLPKAKIVISSENDAKAKNKLLKQLSDCEYLFLVNDTVEIIDPAVFARFILVSNQSGFECMGLASYESSNQRVIYEKDPWVDYWQYPSSGFLFFTQNAIQKAGYLNEGFPPNTWEDVEHIKRIGDLALTAPFGFFIGIKNERRYLSINPELKQKQILEDMKRGDEFKKGTEFWKSLDPLGFPELPQPQNEGLRMKKAQGTMI
jgi:hypothetical protein